MIKVVEGPFLALNVCRYQNDTKYFKKTKRLQQFFWYEYDNNCKKKGRRLPGIGQQQQLCFLAQAFLLPSSN